MDRLLTAEELAQHVGLTARTVRRAASAGRIPCVRIAGSVRFRLEDVLQEQRARRTVRTIPAPVDTGWRAELLAMVGPKRRGKRAEISA